MIPPPFAIPTILVSVPVSLSPVRVLVANQPRLMRDIVTSTVADHADLEIVGQAEGVEELQNLIEATRPDCVVISLEEPDKRPLICDVLLNRYPHLKVLAVTSESNRIFLYWISEEIQSRCIECSSEGILNALRRKTAVREH